MRQLSTLSELKDHYDLVVVGAGPAGLSAATNASAHGLDTIVLDEYAATGGQIYRGLAAASGARRRVVGADYERGDSLLSDFAQSSASYLSLATVWMVSKRLEIGISRERVTRIVTGSHVILANGAIERPFPIPGWTLPGVMTVGAAQSLLKTSGLVPTGKFVIAGTGPLVWQAASQLLRSGAKPAALLTMDTSAQLRQAVSATPEFLTSPYFLQAIALWRHVRQAVKVISGVTMLAAEGAGKLSRVSYRRGERTLESIDTDCLLLHQGVVPNTNLAAAIGCALIWSDRHACWQPATDRWGRSSVRGVSIAGDGAQIIGAMASRYHGALCGLDAALQLGRIDVARRDLAAAPVGRRLAWYRRGRRFVDRAFLPDRRFRLPPSSAVVCRCEEITARQITDVLDSFPTIGPNQLKTFLRCGMGKCQGRSCSLTVTEMIASHRNASAQEVGYLRTRFPVKPITVAELAALPYTEENVRAVVRE